MRTDPNQVEVNTHDDDGGGADPSDDSETVRIAGGTGAAVAGVILVGTFIAVLKKRSRHQQYMQPTTDYSTCPNTGEAGSGQECSQHAWFQPTTGNFTEPTEPNKIDPESGQGQSQNAWSS